MSTEEELRDRIKKLKDRASALPIVKVGDYVESRLHNEIIDILKEMSDVLSQMPIVKYVYPPAPPPPPPPPKDPYGLHYILTKDTEVYGITTYKDLLTTKWYKDYYIERADTGEIVKSRELSVQPYLPYPNYEEMVKIAETNWYGKVGVMIPELVYPLIEPYYTDSFVITYKYKGDNLVTALTKFQDLAELKLTQASDVERADTGETVKSTIPTGALSVAKFSDETVVASADTRRSLAIGLEALEIQFIVKKEVTITRTIYDLPIVKDPVWGIRYEMLCSWMNDIEQLRPPYRDADYEFYRFVDKLSQSYNIERADTGEVIKVETLAQQQRVGIPVAYRDIYLQSVIGRAKFTSIEQRLIYQNYVKGGIETSFLKEIILTQADHIWSSEYYVQLKDKTPSHAEDIEYDHQVPDVEEGSWTVDGNTYRYRVAIDITEQSGNDLTDYAVRIEIDTDYLISEGYMTSAQNEVRFTDSVGNLLSFYRETSKVYWVKIPSLPANSTITIYMYFDSALTEVPDASNGKATFLFFDDVEVWEGWVQYGSGVVLQDSTYVYKGSYSLKKDTYCDPNGGYKLLPSSFTVTANLGLALESWDYRPETAGTDCPVDRFGLEDANFNGYSAFINRYGDTLGIDKRTGGSPTAYTKSSPLGDVPFFVRLILLSGKQVVLLYSDPEMTKLVDSYTLTDTQYSTFDRVVVHGGRPYWLDNIRVRKYAEPEPTSSVHKKWVTDICKDAILTEAPDGGIILYDLVAKPDTPTEASDVVTLGSPKTEERKEVVIEQLW